MVRSLPETVTLETCSRAGQRAPASVRVHVEALADDGLLVADGRVRVLEPPRRSPPSGPNSSTNLNSLKQPNR